MMTEEKDASQLREEALQAESRLEWAEAARLWTGAIERYECVVGQLAKDDIRCLEKNAIAAINMAASEKIRKKEGD